MFWDKKIKKVILLSIVLLLVMPSAVANNSTQKIANTPVERCHSFGQASTDLVVTSPYSQRIAQRQGIKKYRLAITTTGEFAQYHGGTIEQTLIAVTKIIDRANEIYERDLGIRLELIPNNHQLIFTNPKQDPFDSGDPASIAVINQQVVDSIIGADNYDVGHVFSIQGGGIGYINSVCDNAHKAMGFSGINNPIGKRFAIDFFAHELGHQFAAEHTFNSQLGICSGGQRKSAYAVEPGSGSSIMSYAGFCGSDNVKLGVESLFHLRSVEQITRNVWSGKASQCGTIINESIKPNDSLVKTYIVPAHTPLELKLKESDNGSLYAWHQMDAGQASKLGVDMGNNALISPLAPSLNSVRTIPELSLLMRGVTDATATLPTKTRTINLKRLAYKYKSVETATLKLVVINNNQVFGFTQTPNIIEAGEAYPINWETANTEISPIACMTVDISLSVDDNLSFNYSLAEGLINSGEGVILIPNDIASVNKPRFKIKCSNNLFFAISKENAKQVLSLKNTPNNPEKMSFQNTSMGSVVASLDNNKAMKLGAGSLSVMFWIMLIFIFIGKSVRRK